MLQKIEHDRQLGATARWTAAVRAAETEREDRLFKDRWAARLAGAEGMTWMAQRTAESVVAIVLRTRFFDDYLQRMVHEEGLRQIVLMGAGMDTRAFRLFWPDGTRLFELDQAPVLAEKEAALQGVAARCERVAVAADLAKPWEKALFEAGFDPLQPAAWLLEGFLFYLTSEQVRDLLGRALHVAAPGSACGFDAINELTLTSPYTKAWVQMQAEAGAPWRGTLDDPVAFLAQRGWTAALTAPGEAQANYGRWSLPVIAAAMPNMPHLWFVTARKEEHV